VVNMKTGIELLAENPKALQKFCDLLAERATVCELNREIIKGSESLRTQTAAARAINFNTENLMKFSRKRTHPRLLMVADAIGRERGARIGKIAARRMIKEAHRFAELQTATLAPLLDMAEMKDED